MVQGHKQRSSADAVKVRPLPRPEVVPRPLHLGASATLADSPVADQGEPVAAEVIVMGAEANGVELDAMSLWQLSDRADPVAKRLADRHYNRQHPDSLQFVPPGRCVVLRTRDGGAFWITSWPYEEYVQHDWAGAWINSAFRRERGPLASDLIRSAVAATRAYWEPPPLGLVTFVDESKVRGKRDPGYCYLMAGFEHVGYTKGGLRALQLQRAAMPAPLLPANGQLQLWAV